MPTTSTKKKAAPKKTVTPKKAAPKKTAPRKAAPAKKPAKPAAKTATVRGGSKFVKFAKAERAKHRGGPAKKAKAPPVTKRVISKALAKMIVEAEPALRRGRPQISSFGHARHVQGPESQILQGRILEALAKGPRSFPMLGETFPMITDNQLRYQLVILRNAKKVVKVGAREATVYQLAGAGAGAGAAS